MEYKIIFIYLIFVWSLSSFVILIRHNFFFQTYIKDKIDDPLLSQVKTVIQTVSSNSQSTILQQIRVFHQNKIKENSHVENFTEDDSSLNELWQIYDQVNKEQIVYNINNFDLESSVIIVIQVHNRAKYLSQLLNSLRHVRGIEKALIIFSQDTYLDSIQSVIQSVDFCLYMQMFYPYSLQLYTNRFPGPSLNDCPRDINPDKAIKMGCTGAANPDAFGHYREPKITQIKHHWWWKVNHVFDKIRIMEYYKGLVLFLEEDNYVTKDVLHILRLMDLLKKKLCDDCLFLTLGSHEKTQTFNFMSASAEVATWFSNLHNMGLAFNKVSWIKIKQCAEIFCKYDDYNWDWSLEAVGQKCFRNSLKTLYLKATRIFHIGSCGLHSHNSNCDTGILIDTLEDIMKKNEKYLFPSALSVTATRLLSRDKLKMFGGWGDPRDHKLCLNISGIFNL